MRVIGYAERAMEVRERAAGICLHSITWNEAPWRVVQRSRTQRQGRRRCGGQVGTHPGAGHPVNPGEGGRQGRKAAGREACRRQAQAVKEEEVWKG